jgi:hypothetical protein
LAFFRQYRKDASDVTDKAHVEHAVGFVEHQNFDVREVDAALLDMIQQATGGSDQYVHTAA